MPKRVLAVLLLTAITAAAQGPSRPMPGPGLPFPKRGSKNKNGDDKADLDTLKGMLRALTDSEITVEADDKRIFTITRTLKTKFLEREDPVKVETIQPGDRLLIDAWQDDRGRWTAVEVRVTKRGALEDRARARVPVSDEAADEAKQPAGDTERPTTELAIPAPKDIDPDDRPRLARGKSAPRRPSSTEPDEPDPPAKPAVTAKSAPPPPPADRIETIDRDREAAPPSSNRRTTGDDAPSSDAGTRDSFIDKAKEVAENFAESLPNYSVKQFTTRFASDNPRVGWQAQDNVSTDVVYEKGKENYKNILINGKAPKGKVEDSGSWSSGEFGTILRDIFSPATAADFRPSGTATIVNRSAKIYKFVVEQPNSHWRIIAPGQFYFPAFKGTLWIDRETSRVLRIEMSSRNMPKGFPFDTVESAVDYDFIRLGSNPYLLPVHAENLICERGTSTCSKNIIDFRNYRKFGAESNIIFK